MRSSIIVTTYNRSKEVKEAIESVFRHIKDFSDIEVIIINNNSTDDTEVVLNLLNQKYPQIKIYKELNQGLSYAKNRGIQESTGDIVIFLDDDAEIAPDWHIELLSPFLKDDNIAVVGGKVLPFNTQIPSWLPHRFYFLASVFDPSDKEGYMDHVMGGNSAIRKDLLIKSGLFNTKLGRKGKLLLSGEENDMFIKIRSLGYKVFYNPKAIIYHKINEKLNKIYILEYAYLQGVSSANFEKNEIPSKFFIKYILYLLLVVFYYIKSLLEKKYIENEIFYQIKYQYSSGYLNFKQINNLINQ